MRTLLTFVDRKDPFLLGEVEGEDRTGPILSILSSRPFDTAILFYTPHTHEQTETTQAEVSRRHPGCRVVTVPIAAPDPKDYSRIMGSLARHVSSLMKSGPREEYFVCVSSGTAEMRAAWFLLQASGMLHATLLQVGSPASPLFGAANVRELDLSGGDWTALRDLVMPQQYFAQPLPPAAPPLSLPAAAKAEESRVAASFSRLLARKSAVEREVAPSVAAPEPAPAPSTALAEALAEIGMFIGSPVMQLAAERLKMAAETTWPILITGETGTGKEMFAKLAHRLSDRCQGTMIAVNCAAIPRDLVESHLFGHLKGAFTGATCDHKGKFESANGGTLFLDEVGELTTEAQSKLLRAIEHGEIERVGSSKRIKVDVRIVAATNRDLQAMVNDGTFREDLYFRLEVLQVQLPPLRDRPREVPELAAVLLKRVNEQSNRQRRFSKEALKRLEQYDWPGNVRELSNVIASSVVFSRHDVLGPEDILIRKKPAPDPFAALPEPRPGFSLEDFIKQARRHLFQRALAMANGNQSAAAEMLGVSKQAVSQFVKGSDDNPG